MATLAERFPENAPTACPGTDSDKAGKTDACEGCPNQQICSTAPKGPDPDIEKIKENMTHIKHKVLVMSGKGGVGKSTITSQISLALANTGHNVGVVDLDLCGPSIPKLLGAPPNMPVHQSTEGWTPVYVLDNLSVISMPFLLDAEDTAVIWRGSKKTGMIKQFLRDVDWDELDVLLVDTPPGTSDEHIGAAQLIPDISGVILVTTPQEVSLLDVRKMATFCRKVKLPIMGVVENMSGFVCPGCTKASIIFPSTTGGAARLCEELEIPYIGRIPLDPRVGKACDMGGVCIVDKFPETVSGQAFQSLVTHLSDFLKISTG